MTEQQAIELLKSNEKYAIPRDMMLEAENMAIEALEKQIPKKPIKKAIIGILSRSDFNKTYEQLQEEYKDVAQYFCPVCNSLVEVEMRKHEKFLLPYCGCGQAIDWNKEEL